MNTVMYINERLLMTAVYDETGKLIGVTGCNVKAELIELNHVIITKSGFTDYVVLDDNLIWLEPEGR